MKRLLVERAIYFVNAQGAVRRRETSSPRWAWLRKNRGGFDRPTAAVRSMTRRSLRASRFRYSRLEAKSEPSGLRPTARETIT